jgi:hypothetical protein
MSSSGRKFNSRLIGQRLIEAGYLSREQLDEALIRQYETGLLLGEICLLSDWITYAELKACLPPLRSRLGERLLALGYINMEQLWLALLEQRQTGQKLGEVLIVRGWLTLDKLALVLPSAVPKEAAP